MSTQEQNTPKGSISEHSKTGFTDRNGADIREWDVVRWPEFNMVGIIVYDWETDPKEQYQYNYDGSLFWVRTKTGGGYLNDRYAKNWIVDKNVYEFL